MGLQAPCLVFQLNHLLELSCWRMEMYCVNKTQGSIEKNIQSLFLFFSPFLLFTVLKLANV